MSQRYSLAKAAAPASALAAHPSLAPWFLMPTLSQDGTYVSGFLVKAEHVEPDWVKVTLAPNREGLDQWSARLRADATVNMSHLVKES